MSEPKTIITHNGRAHLDDFLAACIVIAKEGGEVYRCPFTPEDLDNPEIFVLDQGRKFEPEKRNFDHHHIKGGAVCAFTQVLEYYGMRDYDALPWISFVEKWDHESQKAAMELVGGGELKYIFNPIQNFVLERFSNIEGAVPADFLGLMRGIGESIIDSFTSFSSTYRDLSQKVTFEYWGWKVADYRKLGLDYELNFEAAGKFEKENQVDIILTYNARGGGKYRMIRKNDKVDFNKAAQLPNGFIHQNGFLICFDDDAELICRATTDL